MKRNDYEPFIDLFTFGVNKNCFEIIFKKTVTNKTLRNERKKNVHKKQKLILKIKNLQTNHFLP